MLADCISQEVLVPEIGLWEFVSGIRFPESGFLGMQFLEIRLAESASQNPFRETVSRSSPLLKCGSLGLRSPNSVSQKKGCDTGNELLSAVNADMIAVNDLVMKNNEEIVGFNAATIAANTKLLEGILPEKATPEANAKRVTTNAEKIASIKDRNDKYNAEMPALHAAIKENRQKIEANAAGIKERRKLILANREAINENGKKIAELLRVDCFAEVAFAFPTKFLHLSTFLLFLTFVGQSMVLIG